MDLKDFFRENPRVALAFSGGVDSAYLLYAAMECKAHVRAYYVKSAFQPRFELEDAGRLAEELGAEMRVLEEDVLAEPQVASNPADRCYHCKKRIFAAIAKAAGEDGFSVLMDGTNASDDAGDRPGMRALRELEVRSPLRECGLTKTEIRRRSKEAGLFTWDKPAYACLATRIPTGVEITEERLCRTERAESYLASVGLRDFRVKMVPMGAPVCGMSWGAKAAMSGKEPHEQMRTEERASGEGTHEQMRTEGMPPGEGANEEMRTEERPSGEKQSADMARLQVTERDLPLLLDRRQEILEELKKYYSSVLLDLEVRG